MNEPKILCRCALCGGELCEGALCYRVDGLCFCTDCLIDFARERFRTSLEYV